MLTLRKFHPNRTSRRPIAGAAIAWAPARLAKRTASSISGPDGAAPDRPGRSGSWPSSGRGASGNASDDGEAGRTAEARRSDSSDGVAVKAPLLRRSDGQAGPGKWLRGIAVATAAAAFLTASGAFSTGDAPLAVRAAYWCALIALGYVWGSAVARLFFAGGRLRTGFPWLDVLLASLVMSVPLTGVVWAASAYAFGGSPDLAGLPYYFGPVFAISVALTAINMLIEMRQDGPAGEPAAEPPRFLERLPLKLRGAAVWAVEAEDHYLRLHTSKGQDLILMRLADAVAELEGIEGAQVHRSWWVARDAIVAARRGDGRATLTLKDGAEVPVSRTYAGALRDRGWI